ncbi:hypothetical protein ACQKM1_01825 [Peribacillus frigoritolerans]|uniref:hypothetical protein n=1 Tax=Peribacillus frigoritolerans TaxID=450367 RepID=UPI003CFBF6E6
MGLAYESQQSISSGAFSVGDSLKKVEKAWGEPEDLSTVAANYWSRNVRFLYDGQQVERRLPPLMILIRNCKPFIYPC